MRRFVPLLLLALPAWVGAEENKDKPGTPAEQFAQLQKDYTSALSAISREMANAKTNEERLAAFQKQAQERAKFARRFLELAEKNPKDPVALDALVRTVEQTTTTDPTAAKALALIARDHIASEKIGGIISRLESPPVPAKEAILRAAIEKNPSKEVQGKAAYSLARHLKSRGEIVRSLSNPERAERYVSFLGKDTVEELKKADPQAAEKQAEEFFELVLQKYPDVKAFRGTIGDAAKGELFELRNLAIGKVAPEITGEDVDGKKFSLSDYRGKVVVLDFWGHW